MTDGDRPAHGDSKREARATVSIVNLEGLHARPCHAIVSTALQFPCTLRARAGRHEVNGKSILELMTLNAGTGTKLKFHAVGEDADVLVNALVDLVSGGFGETLAD